MLLFYYFVLTILLLVLIVFTSYQVYVRFIQPGAIYYPTTHPDLQKMLKLAKLTPKDTLIDIGSGDGRILIAAARFGVKSIGYEINPFLVRHSRRLVRQAGLEKLITIHWKSFWKADFSQATIITVYLFPQYMNRLHKLLLKKAKDNIKIIVNDYPFPKLKAIKKIGTIYLYTLKKGNKSI